MSAEESRKRVALIGPHPPYRGGIAHFTERLRASLSEEGFSVLGMSFSRLYPAVLFPGRSQFEEMPEMAVEASRTIDSIYPWTWKKTARAIVEEGVDAAVFMYWMPFFAPSLGVIARYLRRRGVRTIAVVHNAIPHERHAGDRLLSRSFIRTCDDVIVLSRKVGEDVQSLVPNVPVHIAPHPVYDQFGEKIKQADARGRLDLDTRLKILLYFGIIRRYKGLHVLLDALPAVVEQIPEIRLIVAGEFYDDIASYRTQISSLGLTDVVTLTDEYAPADQVAVLFSAADVVVQPYLTASQSGVVQTAFQFDTPVIVTDVGGLGEIVGDTGAGIVVPPDDREALSSAIRRFFAGNMKPALEEGARRARTSTTWSKYADILREVINKG